MMKTLLIFSAILLYITSSLFSQHVGVGTINPQNALHVVPVGASDPLRVDGLNVYTTERNLLIVNPLSGVIKHIPLDSLVSLIGDNIDTDIDSMRFSNDTLYLYEDNKTLLAHIDLSPNISLIDSLVLANSDSLYNIISDSLLKDTLWLNTLDSLLDLNTDTIYFNDTSYKLMRNTLLGDSLFLDSIDTDVDSVVILNDSIYIFENEKVISSRLTIAIDTVYFNDTSYELIQDSLLVDTFFLDSLKQIIDTDIDSARLMADTSLFLYENEKQIIVDLTNIRDSSEWIDGRYIGLNSNAIYARKLFENGDTICIHPNSRMGIGTNNPSAFLDIKGIHDQHLRIGKLNQGGNIKFVRGLDGTVAGTVGFNSPTTILDFQISNLSGGGEVNVVTNAGSLTSGHFSVSSILGTAPGTHFIVKNDGNVGIATTAPTQRLDVNGNARFRSVSSGAYANDLSLTSDGTLTTNSSDRRLKKNINEIEYGLKSILKLRPVIYNWKQEEDHTKKDLGFIAQEMDEVIPESVFQNKNDGYYGINYSRIIPVLTKAIQEQNETIEIMKKKFNEQDKLILEMRKAIIELQQKKN